MLYKRTIVRGNDVNLDRRERERERERYADVVPSEAEGLGDIILLLCFFLIFSLSRRRNGHRKRSVPLQHFPQ